MKIVHLADIHIVNEPSEHIKFREQFQKLYNELDIIKPDKIVLVGDTLDAFITTSLESETLSAELLNKLATYCEVIVVMGNHEIRKKDLKRQTSIGSVIKMMQNPNITYFTESGFFDDKTEDIVWVNYSHVEKNIIPWRDITHTKDKNKKYIGLFHDPISGCKLPNGLDMKGKDMVKMSDFKKNDLSLLGDIHLRQFFGDTIAYPGSILQLTFGEKPENHGFLLWEIDGNNITHKEYDLQNDYTKITFRIEEGFDYDNIKFINPLATKKSEFKVIWSDYSANINNENEEKIKKYFRDTWDTESLIFEKNRVYTNVASSEKLTESININNKQVQQDIFKEYLKANKYDKVFIDEILSIDDIVDSRLELTSKIDNVEWSIEKLWVNNFKSYKEFEIDWTDISGIIQLSGENQQGKTTILDAITYITHGTTLSTNKLGGGKKEKNGDNRYINNKRTEDFCNGGMIINVNGNRYTLFRETKRSWKRDKITISSCPTTLDYYNGTEINEENKLRGERRTDTQTMIDSIIGDFDDFIRITLTNSENLNYLISLDRATFIDSVIKDAGYDIFEKKLSEFKTYKSEQNVNKIDINLSQAVEETEGLKTLLKTLKIEHDECKSDTKVIDDKVKEIHTERDTEFKKLNKIDDEISKLNIDKAKEKIEEYKETIESNLNTQNNNTIKMKSLKTTYDKESYESFLKELKTIDDDIISLKLKTSQTETKIEKEKGNIERVNDKVKQLKQKEITSQKSKLVTINNDIEKINEKLKTAISDKKRDLEDDKKTQDFKSQTLTTEINNIKEKGSDKNKQKLELEETDSCPVCGASPEHQSNRNEKIKSLKEEIVILMKDGKGKVSELKELKEEIILIEGKINDVEKTPVIVSLKEEIKKELEVKRVEIEDINKICIEIEEDNFNQVTELKNSIDKGLKIKEISELLIIDLETKITDIKKDIKTKETEKIDTQDKVSIIEKDKNEVKSYETLNQQNTELTLKIENIKLTIENAKTKIDKYYDQLKFVEQNKIINEKISELDSKIDEQDIEKNDLIDKLSEIMKEASVTKDSIKDIQKNVEKYKKQVKRDEILKEYQKCVHRDGIPTFLLQKSKDLINIELEDMLTNVDFNVYFDDQLNLKMYDKKMPYSLQNLLEGSGKERTFGAIALKLALRTINQKSRPNLLLLDEIMLKLKGKSVTEFNNMLLYMKSKIDKIVIIEHVHDIPFDILIEVEKGENGVSSLKITN